MSFLCYGYMKDVTELFPPVDSVATRVDMIPGDGPAGKDPYPIMRYGEAAITVEARVNPVS
ncbi:hypothetical protein GCM10023157_32220 [Gluconacetobacter asukensis]